MPALMKPISALPINSMRYLCGYVCGDCNQAYLCNLRLNFLELLALDDVNVCHTLKRYEVISVSAKFFIFFLPLLKCSL